MLNQEENCSSMLWMADYPSEGARRFPDKLAIIDKTINFTYQQLDDASNRFADFLRSRGVVAGDRIAYLGKNNSLFFPVLFGCLRAGVILAPLNWRYAPAELAFVLQDGEPKLLIHDTEFSTIVASDAVANIPASPAAMVVEGEDDLTLEKILCADTRPGPRVDHDTPDDCALLMYTSGTTGHPKGVMLSHRALSLSRWVEIGSPWWTDWNDDDIILSAMPNFHIGGLSWMLIGLLRSLTCVLTADPSPANLFALCRDHHVTRTFMVPTVVRGFAELAATEGAPKNLKGIYYGAALMDAGLLKRCLDVLDSNFSQYFGMTENCGSITFLPAQFHDPGKPELLRSVGLALRGMEISIRDPHGTPCPTGQSGEIWVKADTLMIGYWKQPTATNEVLVDGWYRTGDGGYVNGDGFVFLTDRLKDTIISGGENIYPAEVEEMLRNHPAIREVVVVGSPDPKWGEVVTALVEWKDGQSATVDELREFGRSYIAGYKLPRLVQAVTALPRTATGKLQRGAARRLFAAPKTSGN